MAVRRIAAGSRELWERFAPFASATWMADHFPPSVGGLSRPGWEHNIRTARKSWPELPWVAVSKGKVLKVADDEIIPEPVYDDELPESAVRPAKAADPAVELTTAEKVERDHTLQRLKAEKAELQKKYDHLVKTGNLHEAVLEIVRENVQSFHVPTIVVPKVSSGGGTEDAIIGWADQHGGERVSFEVMGGLNQYGPVETCRRLQYTVDKTLSLLFGNHSGTTFEKLYVFDMGDTITGDGLDDNKATNPFGVFMSMKFMAEIKARALTELSTYLPIVYVAVPGNHGRRGAKMPWKQPSETADWLIAEWIRTHCKDNDRIEFVIPNAWSAVVNIRGHNHWVNHGYAAAKGGNGGIPWYAYMRRDGKMTAIESRRDEKVRYRWYGHIHTQAEIPKMGGSGEQFIVGSLKGGDEYALNELGEYGDPVQKLVGCSEKYGVTFRYPLDVKHGDSKPSRYEDAIPEMIR